MTEIDQRIALAKLVGWFDLKPSGRLDGQIKGYPPKGAIIGQPQEIPKLTRGDLQPVLDLIGTSAILTNEFMNQLRSLFAWHERRDFECVRADGWKIS